MREIKLPQSTTIILIAVLITAATGIGFGLQVKENQELKQELFSAKSSLISLEVKTNAKNIKYTDLLDESRIGTDPDQVIPRIYRLFQQDGITMDPYACRYSTYGYCYTQILYEEKLYEARNPSELLLYLATNEEATKYYDRLLSIFLKNLYVIQPETANELNQDGTRYRRSDITHPQNDIICGVELTAVESDPDPYLGRSNFPYPFIRITCSKLNEDTMQYIAMQKAIAVDLDLAADTQLVVKSFTDRYALINDLNDCMLIQKSNSKWVILESTSCQDPVWGRGSDSLATSFQKKYGIPFEDAEILGDDK
ncbi:hypothetical protein KBC89_01240 [Candidatus Woesebacteria bacterium]|nr:hypothetical protein [Candidatus Woesebacteria bacterium]